MLTLFSYPRLFGVADNNGYGLKVFAFLRLAGMALTIDCVDRRVTAHEPMVRHCRALHAAVSQPPGA
jgi:hypothetical protein